MEQNYFKLIKSMCIDSQSQNDININDLIGICHDMRLKQVSVLANDQESMKFIDESLLNNIPEGSIIVDDEPNKLVRQQNRNKAKQKKDEVEMMNETNMFKPSDDNPVNKFSYYMSMQKLHPVIKIKLDYTYLSKLTYNTLITAIQINIDEQLDKLILNEDDIKSVIYKVNEN